MQRPNDCEYTGMVECDPSTRNCDLCGWDPAIKEKRLRKLEKARINTPVGKRSAKDMEERSCCRKMKVLVVVDMQDDFIGGALGTPEARSIVGKVVKKIREFDGATICVTRDTHGQNYLDTQEGKLLPVKHCIMNTDGWKLQSDVMAACRERAIDGDCLTMCDKNTFGSVQLGATLADLNEAVHIDEVVLIGLCTDICVISNALLVKAFLPETKITVDADCCAGVTPESHVSALAAMKMCQINIENGG